MLPLTTFDHKGDTISTDVKVSVSKYDKIWSRICFRFFFANWWNISYSWLKVQLTILVFIHQNRTSVYSHLHCKEWNITVTFFSLHCYWKCDLGRKYADSHNVDIVANYLICYAWCTFAHSIILLTVNNVFIKWYNFWWKKFEQFLTNFSEFLCDIFCS